MKGKFRGTLYSCESKVREGEGATVLGALFFGLPDQTDVKITGVNLEVGAAVTILIGTEVPKILPLLYRKLTAAHKALTGRASLDGEARR
jgi:hypothetical protein